MASCSKLLVCKTTRETTQNGNFQSFCPIGSLPKNSSCTIGVGKLAIFKSSQVKASHGLRNFGQVKPQVKSLAQNFGQVKPQVKSQAQENCSSQASSQVTSSKNLFKSSLKSSHGLTNLVKSSVFFNSPPPEKKKNWAKSQV